MSAETQVVAFLQEHDSIIGLAKFAGAFDDGRQHRLDVGRRRGDHIQDIRAAGLVSQRLFEIVGLGLRLIEQPCIFDRKHRLGGEAFEQADFPLRERLHLETRADNHAEEFSLAAQRYSEEGSRALKRDRTQKRNVRVPHVANLEIARSPQQCLDDLRLGDRPKLPQLVRQRLRQSMYGNRANGFSVQKLQAAVRDAAQRMRVAQDRVEYRCKISWRGIDDFEDLGRRHPFRAGFGQLGGARLELAPKRVDDALLIGFARHRARHRLPFDLARLVRGSTRRNAVNAPGSVSTSMVPPCCFTMMSWLIDNPSPVPSPAGLVVKKGLNIFSFTSGGMPVPLSRMRISTWASLPRVVAVTNGSKSPPPSSALRLVTA